MHSDIHKDTGMQVVALIRILTDRRRTTGLQHFLYRDTKQNTHF